MLMVTESVAAVVVTTGTATSAVYDHLYQGAYDTGWTSFRATIYADKAGTLAIQYSDDGTNWRTETSGTNVAGTLLEVVGDAIERYVRALWTNTAGTSTSYCEMHTVRELQG
jgi:2-keto-3-deoxy-galactonokinase